MENNKTTEPFKTVDFEEQVVTTPTVSCDDGELDGHPRVFLDVGKTGKVICPYCSRAFVLSNKLNKS